MARRYSNFAWLVNWSAIIIGDFVHAAQSLLSARHICHVNQTFVPSRVFTSFIIVHHCPLRVFTSFIIITHYLSRVFTSFIFKHFSITLGYLVHFKTFSPARVPLIPSCCPSVRQIRLSATSVCPHVLLSDASVLADVLARLFWCPLHASSPRSSC